MVSFAVFDSTQVGLGTSFKIVIPYLLHRDGRSPRLVCVDDTQTDCPGRIHVRMEQWWRETACFITSRNAHIMCHTGQYHIIELQIVFRFLA